MDFIGVHPADPYELLRLMDDDCACAGRPRRAGADSSPRSAGAASARWRRRRRRPSRGGAGSAQGSAHSKKRDSSAISQHYDVSNTFYEYVLGPSMTYTCAVYPTGTSSLDRPRTPSTPWSSTSSACRPGAALLDVGCGWGSMVRHAARRGVRALGVTLSRQQAEWAQKAIVNEGLQHLAEIRHLDYRDVPETGFDAISSIGLTEHIGVRNYPAYFRSLQDKLRARRPAAEPLHHPADNYSVREDRGVHRPLRLPGRRAHRAPDGSSSAMQDAGFDVRHSENIREHYALTLRDWCANLRENWDACVDEVGEGTARVWGLYMAGSRLSFERNGIQLHQVLARQAGPEGRRAVPLRPWWRG